MSDIRKYFSIQSKNTSLIKKENITNNTNTSLNNIIVFTDGSSINNGSKKKEHYGGIGIYIQNTIESISEKLLGKITNNIAELKACIKAINIISQKPDYDNNKIIIYTDSEYVINSITKWSLNWKKNNWKKYDKRKKEKKDIKNKELIKELNNLYHKYPIIFNHIKAHQTEPNNKSSNEYKLWYGNNIADKLAVTASLS